MKNYKWLLFILITMVTWGVWGAFSEIPEKAGFPATMTYIVWALSMIPCAVVALGLSGWKLETDRRSIGLGVLVGLLGAGGQLILFQALRFGPAYIIFPFISMAPVVVISLSMLFLKERASKKQTLGIIAALAAIFLLSWQGGSSGEAGSGYLWIVFASLVFLMWGVQGFSMKFANNTMRAESIFVYMAITALLVTPVAWLMTDFDAPGIDLSMGLATKSFFIQILNSVGALTLVYAYRYGKAILVSPMEGLAPLITVVLSLIIYAVFPAPITLGGLILAVFAMIFLALE
jgi:drug/metabolite transporter (DMT)-like permease